MEPSRWEGGLEGPYAKVGAPLMSGLCPVECLKTPRREVAWPPFKNNSMALQWHWAALLLLLVVFIRHHWREYFNSSWIWFSSSKCEVSFASDFLTGLRSMGSILKGHVARKDQGKKNIENLRLFCVFCCWQQKGLLPHLEAGTHRPSFSFFCLCTSRSPSYSLSSLVSFSFCAHPVYVRV